jgi:hypothetical protein
MPCALLHDPGHGVVFVGIAHELFEGHEVTDLDFVSYCKSSLALIHGIFSFTSLS